MMEAACEVEPDAFSVEKDVVSAPPGRWVMNGEMSTPVTARPSAHLRGGGVGGDEFATVAGDVRVHALGDGLEERGLAVVAAAHDEGQARGDRHAGHLAGMRQGDGGAQGFGGAEGDDAVTGQGRLGHAGSARQQRVIGNEGYPPAFFEDPLEGAVVLVGGNVAE